MDELGPRAASKRIAVSARFPVDTIRGHRFALHVLLRNVLANTIAYTPEDGRVEVNSFARDGAVVLTIDDSGPGIRAEDRERAFERFNRLGATQVEGVGLGLSIVHSVVELHRAQLRLLDSPIGGLRVEVVFRAPTYDASRLSTRPS
jgi:signal transduction histidine kinase